MQGTIVLQGIHYVVYEGSNRFSLAKTPLLPYLIPGDHIYYTLTQDNQALVTDFLSVTRTAQTTLAIVRSLTPSRFFLFCPLLGPLYNPFLSNELQDVHVGDRFLLRLPSDPETLPVLLKKFPSIYNRLGDLDSLMETYQTYTLPPSLKLTLTTPLYTKDPQKNIDKFTFSIDPVGCKDADDALTVLPEENRILIHIVDIASLLKDSGSDFVAAGRAFTLYLPNKISHILPEGLATDLYSLKVGAFRKVITVDVRFEPGTMTVKSYDIYQDMIVNTESYTYEEALALIETPPRPEFAYIKSLSALDTKQSLCIPQIRLDIDPTTGQMTGYRSETNIDVAHKFIERMMILANSLVSQHLSTHCALYSQIPQRFHSKLRTLTSVESSIPLSPPVQSFLAIKEFATAKYSVTETGHFGLGLSSYTHFTSPIRRYFDVVIHRLLAGAVYDEKSLAALLDHINVQERKVDALQKLHNKWKICSWLKPGMTFRATVTGVNRSGVYFLVEELMVDGYVHVSKLGTNQRWALEEEQLRSTAAVLQIGSPLTIRIDDINIILGTMDVSAQLS
jgi:exoribonuclease R